MKLMKFVIFIIVAFLPSLTAFFVRTDGWYNTLVKPVWMPPSWIFGPVWTVLYFTIGVSGFLAWQHSNAQQRQIPFTLFGIHLIINALWTVLFFGFHNPALAFVDIFILLSLIIVLMRLFYARSKAASLLLVPYALWVLFASVLNLTLYFMN